MAATVWRGFITFGLISIPVRLYRAARAERIQFRRLLREEAPAKAEGRSEATEAEPRAPAKAVKSGPQLTLVPRRSEAVAPAVAPALTPVKQAAVRAGTDQVLPSQSVVKGYEYEKNRFVEVEPELLKSAAAETSREMQIQEFVRLADIDPVYFETSYYLAPDEAGEKAYALLYEAMQATGLMALARLAMHNREHVVALRPGKSGLLVHTMFFAAEVRSDEEYRADVEAVNQKELDLAKTLIHSLASAFEPEKYHDTYREKLEAILASKLAGRSVSVADVPKAAAKVDDLTEALRQSLENLRKPAAKEQAAEAPARPKAKRKPR